MSGIRFLLFLSGLLLIPEAATQLFGQKISRFKTEEMELVYFGKRYSYVVPHVARTYQNALNFHKKHWDYRHELTTVMLTDFEDNGHGGAIVMPDNLVILGISPFDYAFSITPSNERFQWLFNHELTHVTLADKPNRTDLFWRKALLGKVRRDEKTPVSAIWSYLTTPRWYAPRWYHEGIACYLETWMSGGVGRSLGPYDEMYFRSIVHANDSLYSVVGLDTEGTTIDFQVGANSYLYGTRFITYLAQQYGDNKVVDFYNRTDDSKAFYGNRFKQVFGRSVEEIWDEWTHFEQQFQTGNLKTIREYPVTSFRALTPGPMGSFSTIGFNEETGKIYAAVNAPGNISQIVEMDLVSGNFRKVAVLDSPVLYSVTSLAYDPGKKQIFVSEHNTKFRNLVQVDVATGKKKELIEFSRTGHLTYDPAGRAIWGVKHDNGYANLVKIPEPYTEIIPLFTADFGKSLIDPAISHDGNLITLTMTGIRGEQSIIMFRIKDLEKGIKKYEVIKKLDDNTLTQFRFSKDDKYLIGTSYYTGVSNIWRIGLDDHSFELMSNVETGLFLPQQINDDSLFVLNFHRDGMQPGIIPIQVIQDANSIEYLGNRVIAKNPQVVDYSLPPASKIKIDSLKLDESAYIPIKNMHLSEGFLDISGYKETIVLGYRVNWRDRIGLSNLGLFVGTSPWSAYPGKQQFHGQLTFDYWMWNFNASYNKTDFYDLFGPTRRSRAGYSLGAGYKKTTILKSPVKWNYAFSLNHYGDLEVLPQFQNVEAPIKNFQSLSADLGTSKLRKTLGGVEDEKGYIWNLTGYSYLANGEIFPSLISEQHFGVLVPGIRNTSFWIRNSLGQAFGAKGSAFSAFYFGGFRNNFVDWQAADQYRKILAFPGVNIDEISARNFIKTMGELNLKPLRLRDVGTTYFYPVFLKASIFATHLITDPDDNPLSRNVFNTGVQIDLETVLFSYLKTTWSAGYARKYETGINPAEQWMFSLKLLGN